MDDFAEEALSHHMGHHHFRPAEAAVFQEHEGRAGFFISAHQIPAFLNAGGAAHLDAHGDSLFHGADGEGHVGFPGRNHQNRVQIARVQHFVVTAISPGGLAGFFPNRRLGLFRPVAKIIAHGDDFHALQIHQKIFYKSKATAAQSGHAGANGAQHKNSPP